MRIGIVILCRMGSERLPGKILQTVSGRSVLSHIVARAARGAPGTPVAVATSTDASDDALASYCRRSGIDCFRGDLDDVAGRFHACAASRGWEYAVRINGDNLFTDPPTLRAMLALAETERFDFITNVPGRTFPYGMSIEIVRLSFYRRLLEDHMNRPADREHVTSWLYENPSVGSRYVYENRFSKDAAGLKLALDTTEDLTVARAIFRRAATRGIGAESIELPLVTRLARGASASSPWRGAVGPLLVAEIGGNHEGDFSYAKELTAAALSSGADCVKFQIYRGDALVSPVEGPQRNRHFKAFELKREQHIELAEMCRAAGVKYLASVWDEDSLDWIDPYLDIYKVGSGDLTAWPLLRVLAERGKPILLSTGLATMDEVAQAVGYLQRINSTYLEPEALCLLQCTSMYPIPDSEANLRVMDSLRRETGLAVGYSDHTEGTVALVTAAAMGAEALEFHFTDDREGKTFRDHKVSLTPDEVRELKGQLAKVSALRGSDSKEPQPSELEAAHDVSFRRAVYVTRPVRAGERLGRQDLVVLRPAHGTDARDYERVVGSRALRDLTPFEALRWDVDFVES